MPTASGADDARLGKNSWYPRGSGNLPATLLPFLSSLFIVGRPRRGAAVSLHELSSVPRLAASRPMFFFDRCQSKYAWALSAALRLHKFETPEPANRLVHRVEPGAADGTSPRAGRGNRGRPASAAIRGRGVPANRRGADCIRVTRTRTKFDVWRGDRAIARCRCDAPGRRCTDMVRHGAQACAARRKTGETHGYGKARSLQSSIYAGPACAMPGRMIDGEKDR